MPVKARSLVSLRISDMSICCRDTALFFWDVWSMEKMPESPLCPKYGTDDPGAFMWCERTAVLLFSKNSMPQLKMHLANSPSLRAAYTGQYAEIFSSEPPKGRSDASGPITWYCKIWDCLHRGLRKWSEYVWGFRNEVCHGQCRWDSEKEADHMLPDCDHNGVTEGLRYWKWWLLKPSFFLKIQISTAIRSRHTTQMIRTLRCSQFGHMCKIHSVPSCNQRQRHKSVVTIVSTFIIHSAGYRSASDAFL